MVVVMDKLKALYSDFPWDLRVAELMVALMVALMIALMVHLLVDAMEQKSDKSVVEP